MKIQTFAILSALFLVAAPLAVAEEHGEDQGPPEESTWGLCQAEEASQPGNEASNGTVNETPPFQDVDEEDCENAERPGNGTASDDRPGADDHPDEDDNPGDDRASDHPDEDDNAGDEQEPDHPDDEDRGSDEGDDRRP